MKNVKDTGQQPEPAGESTTVQWHDFSRRTDCGGSLCEVWVEESKVWTLQTHLKRWTCLTEYSRQWFRISGHNPRNSDVQHVQTDTPSLAVNNPLFRVLASEQYSPGFLSQNRTPDACRSHDVVCVTPTELHCSC